MLGAVLKALVHFPHHSVHGGRNYYFSNFTDVEIEALQSFISNLRPHGCGLGFVSVFI